ncbi:MAG TPA: DUF5808 domain-containing protein [Polyangiaceae bacterium]|nr:DUF5808 domain-containing protein [Polyangiaceae bacterium]
MDQPSRRALPRWPSFAVLLLAASYLALRLDAIPARWIIHWGVRGQPNGWATRTIPGVFGVLAFTAIVLVFTETLGMARRNKDGAAGEALRSATVDFVRFSMLGVSLMTAFLAIDLPLGPPMPLAVLLSISVAPLVISMAVGGIRLTAAHRRARESGHGAKVEGYHAFYYAKSSDQRLWVPKRSGMGWTINFAHPLGWPMLLLTLAIPIAALIASAMAR